MWYGMAPMFVNPLTDKLTQESYNVRNDPMFPELPVMWEINGQWYCKKGDFYECELPKGTLPLHEFLFNLEKEKMKQDVSGVDKVATTINGKYEVV